MDHQMNQKATKPFGQYFQRSPSVAPPTIVCGNALRLDWKQVLPPSDDVLVLGILRSWEEGNQNASQKADMQLIWGRLKGSGNLDYVTAGPGRLPTTSRLPYSLRFSHDSITQGEQVGILWATSCRRQIKIYFAHRTFPWMSEARGKAHVHV